MNKRIFLSCLISILMSAAFTVNSQLQTPKLSPLCTVEQAVGLTNVKIVYSRPSKRDRVIFGKLVPYNEIWRLGANKNTSITSADDLIFSGDTLPKGTYAVYAKPGKQTWDVFFYKDHDNWGTPDEWDESRVALKLSAPVQSLSNTVESLTIGIDAIGTKGAVLSIAWDRVRVVMPFTVDTRSKVEKSIAKVMSGPSANDYYGAAKYYFAEKVEAEKALEWINKAVELRGAEAYWVTHLQAKILAWNGDYKRAIEAAQLSMKAAAEKGSDNYVRMNEELIATWRKK